MVNLNCFNYGNRNLDDIKFKINVDPLCKKSLMNWMHMKSLFKETHSNYNIWNDISTVVNGVYVVLLTFFFYLDLYSKNI